MKTPVGISAAIIFTAIGVLHIYWGFGGRWWTENIVPVRDGVSLFNLIPAGFFVVSALFFFAAWVVLVWINLVGIPLPPALLDLGISVMSVVFLIRVIGDFQYAGIFKSITGTPFAYWDTRIYTPISALLSAMMIILRRF